MLAFYIYLIGIVDKLIMLFIAYSAIVCALSFMIFCDSPDDSNAKSISKKFLISAICTFTITIFIPSSKTLASMIMIPAVVNNEQVQNIGKNSLTVLEELTKQWVIDITLDSNKESDV